jgi:hypothetical protein
MNKQSFLQKYFNISVSAFTLISSLLLFIDGCFRGPDATAIKKHYVEISKKLRPYCDGFFIKGVPEAAMLLDQKWSLEAEWVIAFLNDHPGATVQQIESAIHSLHVNGSATALGENLYGVSIQEGEIGNVFLVASDGKRFRLVWNAKDAMLSLGKKGNFLRPWSAKAAMNDCRKNASENDWLSCGPLYGGFRRLPDDKMKRYRFYLKGAYAEYAGMNAAAQLSIWSWDGSVLRPQFTGTYTYYIDQSVGTRLERDMLKIRVREQYRTFHTCCNDEGRPMDWNLRLTSTGVEDRGKTPVFSELEIIDELFYRIARMLSADDLASSEAQSQAHHLIRQQPKEHGLPNFGSLMTTTSKSAGDVDQILF